RTTRFGEYELGQTISEEEGVKVKMAFHSQTGMRYVIRRYHRRFREFPRSERVKIIREVDIQRDLGHPNVQRFHELVETEMHIGLVLEYPSGGELFEYVLNHRYLRDKPARRLFAQLISAVGYLHLKGVVHRNLKLETVQLDRYLNIIVTCFDLAKTFDPTNTTRLQEVSEYSLPVRDLKDIDNNARFGGDLMRTSYTSCGSPCYAAPELVVSDRLYTGRKADIWSCGVILVGPRRINLYAMLAGHLPFDDDPANPDGDNINLLYKYIVSTPVTFPEYVTPHARDLLRRILVPDPSKRSDMYEIARHSWLSEYAHVVSHITDKNTPKGIIGTTIPSRAGKKMPGMYRSVPSQGIYANRYT
ncbi:kinase-like protein, partial [Lophium mytilinum]